MPGGQQPQQQITDAIVSSYLSKRGLKHVDAALRHDPTYDPTATGFILLSPSDSDNTSISEQYDRLQKWVDDSIDVYRVELQRVLYPVFVHAYLDLVQSGGSAKTFLEAFGKEHAEVHGDELRRLSSVVDGLHLQQNELVLSFRDNKYGVGMCKYSFELLLSFLQDNRFMLIIRLINQYITIQGKLNE